MAILIDPSTGTPHVLKPYHVFGRSLQHADCNLPDEKVSLIHATARWSAPHWTLTDQSRNGSFINGEPLARNQVVILRLGDEIRFGMPDAPAWVVTDVSAPADMLLPVSAGLPVIALQDFQVLPNEESPLVCIYRSSNGPWLQETSDGPKALAGGDLVQIDQDVWRLVCLAELQSTLVPSGFTCMKFEASLDEEHIRLSLTRGSLAVDLGERNHHYLLLMLARQRLQDAEAGFDPHAQGWIDFDQLVDMLRLDKAHLNIQIFRLRKQFEEAVAQGLIGHDFIERRRGGVRLGNVAVEVFRGSQLEGRWKPGAVSRTEGAFPA